MTGPGTRRINPVTGERMDFLNGPGTALSVQITAHPGWPGPPVHVHGVASERFAVHSGTLRLRTGRDWTTLRSGDVSTAAAGTPHAYLVPGERLDEPAVFTVELVPPGGMAAFWQGVFDLADAGRVNAQGRPHLLGVARLFDAHSSDIALAGIPGPAQRVMWRVLAGVDRGLHR